jgi:pimeloyl-ACP methyl ester carboxylesterase
LAWSETGDPGGVVVVYCHGTGASANDVLFPEVGERLKIRLLTADRPGYGGSAAQPNASFSDLARVMLRDLDEFGVERFSLLGFSGGGPHALAVAHAAPARVRAVGLVSSWAPMDPPDPGLPAGVRFAMRVGSVLPRSAVQLMLTFGRRPGAGMVDDVCRVARPWGFDVEDVASSVPVVIWHAERDAQVPLAPWRAVEGITLNVVPGDAHDPPPELWEHALRGITSVE